MAEPGAFLSYVWADDDHDRGYITELRNRLASEVRMQTGEDFMIFQDRKDILWGERWRSRISQSIDATTLLIAVITPAFFKSDVCREELEQFLLPEKQLGRDDLILPLYYVTTPALGGEDPLASEIGARQYVDWRPLRFNAFEDLEVRRRLADLATQIVAALERPAVSALPTLSLHPELDDLEDEAPGFIELVAEAEDAMPLFHEVITEFTSELQSLASLAERATVEMQAANTASKPASAKLAAAHRLAKVLEEPAGRMEPLADQYREQLTRLDGGMIAIIQQVPSLTEEEDVAAARELRESLLQLKTEGGKGIEALASFVLTLRQVGRLSSALRPVFRRITSSVNRIGESREVFERWEEDMDRALDQL